METTASMAFGVGEGLPVLVVLPELPDKARMAVSDVILFMPNYKRYVLIWPDSPIVESGSRGSNGGLLIIFIAY